MEHPPSAEQGTVNSDCARRSKSCNRLHACSTSMLPRTTASRAAERRSRLASFIFANFFRLLDCSREREPEPLETLLAQLLGAEVGEAERSCNCRRVRDFLQKCLEKIAATSLEETDGRRPVY